MNPLKLLPLKFEIELSAHCNRNCSWCTNKFTDRINNFERIELKYIEKIIKELADLQWRGYFSLSHYNEPMYEIDRLKYVAYLIKKYLPNSRIHFNTNGDFLNQESLENLYVDNIMVSDYDNKGIIWFENKKIELDLIDRSKNEDYKQTFFEGSFGENIEINFVLNWQKHKGKYLEDRAGELTEKNIPEGMHFLKEGQERKEKCPLPFAFNSIEYNGNIVPCCHMRSELQPQFIYGNIKEQTLLEIYSSDGVKKIQKELYNLKYEGCKYCHKVAKDHYARFYELEE